MISGSSRESRGEPALLELKESPRMKLLFELAVAPSTGRPGGYRMSLPYSMAGLGSFGKVLSRGWLTV